MNPQNSKGTQERAPSKTQAIRWVLQIRRQSQAMLMWRGMWACSFKTPSPTRRRRAHLALVALRPLLLRLRRHLLQTLRQALHQATSRRTSAYSFKTRAALSLKVWCDYVYRVLYSLIVIASCLCYVLCWLLLACARWLTVLYLCCVSLLMHIALARAHSIVGWCLIALNCWSCLFSLSRSCQNRSTIT